MDERRVRAHATETHRILDDLETSGIHFDAEILERLAETRRAVDNVLTTLDDGCPNCGRILGTDGIDGPAMCDNCGWHDENTDG